MKIKTTQTVAIAALCLVLVLSAVYIFFMRSEDVREDIKAAPKAVQPEKAVAQLDLKADKKQLIVNPDALKDIRLVQGQINIPGTAPVAEPETLDIQEEETLEAKPLQDYNYISVSIASTGEQVISSSIPDDKKEIEQYKMVSVENMGQPQGVSFKPQPVKAMAQKGMESEELKRLKEIKLKRKSNFAKELEERRARKGLYYR